MEKIKTSFLTGTLATLAWAAPVRASAGEVDLELAISAMSFKLVGWATVILLTLVVVAALLPRQKRQQKKLAPVKRGLFITIVTIVLLTSTFLIGSTIYLNNVSVSKGPVHWHADTEIYACGQELDLQDPTGFLSNKIGTATLHEHNDKRIHLEGVVVESPDASLEKFFKVIDGEISDTSITVPTNDGAKSFANGDLCADGQPGQLQVWAYRADADTKTYTVSKLDRIASYQISPHSNVPPGDCLVFEFGPVKESTDIICKSYEVAEATGRFRRAGQ